jgi:transmembrane sensor
MSSNPLRLKFLFQKYLDNACTKEDLKEFWHLMSQLSEEDLVAIQLQELWKNENNSAGELQKTKSVNWQNAYNVLQQRIAEHETDYVKIASGKRVRVIQIAVAASVACVIIAITYFLYNRPVVVPLVIAKVNNYHSGPQIIHLSDSSIVTLSAKSKLDYPANFNNSTREVYLTGEAYFNVKHNSSRQFIVHSGTIITRVLGTAFNIKAIPGESKVSITVTRGKVLVQRADTKKTLGILLPGNQMTVNDDDTYYSEKINIQQVTGWRHEHLVFDDITFAEAAALVGLHFGVEIKFANEALRNCRFTGNFSGNTLDETLDIIGELTKSTWKRGEGRVIWLEGKGCE